MRLSRKTVKVRIPFYAGGNLLFLKQALRLRRNTLCGLSTTLPSNIPKNICLKSTTILCKWNLILSIRQNRARYYFNFVTSPRYESLNQTQWQFHPNGVISNNLCGVPETEKSMNFVSSENSRFAGITSRHITVKDNYAAYFKVS